jgi:hypothetical protein
MDTMNKPALADPTTAASLDGTEEGWQQTLDRLAEYLAKA